MNQQTEGFSPKATGAGAGAVIGGALATVLCYVLPGDEPTEVVLAIGTLCSAVLAFVGAYLPKPGVVVLHGHGEDGEL